MNIKTKEGRPALRPGRFQWWRWSKWPGGGATFVALYVMAYVTVRTRHATGDGRFEIRTGSRMMDRLFAPAILTEKSSLDRPIPNAELLMESALREARSSGRKVLLAIGSKNCLPCRQLERFVGEQSAILSKYFVVVKIDVGNGMVHGDVVQKQYRAEQGALGDNQYFPWLAFLNANGDLLVTSDDSGEGMIGIPQGGPQDRAWFLRMLRIANPAITDDEIASMDAAAEAYHNLIWSKGDRGTGHKD
jgi:thioredoxin-related protein